MQGLAEMLRRMGADIRGEGTNTVVIKGASRLHGTEYRIIPDRVEAGTFAIAAAITGGDVEVHGAVPGHITSLIHKLREAGASVDTNGNCLRVAAGSGLRGVTVQALPYPGFASDLQAPMAVLLTQADGPQPRYGARLRQSPALRRRVEEDGRRHRYAGQYDCYH